MPLLVTVYVKVDSLLSLLAYYKITKIAKPSFLYFLRGRGLLLLRMSWANVNSTYVYISGQEHLVIIHFLPNFVDPSLHLVDFPLGYFGSLRASFKQIMQSPP